MSQTATFDAAAFKSATRRQWDASALGWDRQGPLIREWLGEVTRAMLAMADIRAGDRVLDVAAGAGDQTLDIAELVGASGEVLATDISAAILELALVNARRAGFTNVSVRVADCESLGLDGAGFDAAVSRLGLMFLPEPVQGLREIRAALKPSSAFCAVVFSTPATNPCVAILMQTALAHAGLAPRDPFAPGSLFSLGKPGLLDALFRDAGFADVATTRISAPFRLPGVDDYLTFVRASASPIQMILSGLDDAAREAAWEDMRARLSVYSGPGGWEGPNELLLTTGKAA